MKRKLLLLLGAAAVALLTTDICFAKSTGAGPEEQTIAEEMKAQEDPTIIKRRIWTDTEWSSYKHGREDVLETVGALWSWRVSDDQDWALRLKLPYKFHIAGDAAGDSNEQGIDDIKLGAGTAFRLSETWRTGFGVEMRFPTAHDDLGNNTWRPQLFGALAWDVMPKLTLSPSFEYNKSIAEEHGAAPQNFIEMYFPVTFILPRYWAVTTRYEAKVDFENDNSWKHSAKFAISKRLEQQPLTLSLSIKKTFDGGDKEFQMNFILTWYFRGNPL